ncbi:MAG: sigma-54 dependent transcriptional regulator [Anaerovoracaceae bacterium]
MNNERTIKILVVDDEENVRQLLEKVLVKEGYNVYLAEDGERGLEVIQNKHINIIISDIKMPNMDGLTFLSEVRKTGQDIGFILITAFATMETAIEALKSGAQDYVTKPFDIKEILASVKRVAIGTKQGKAFDGEDISVETLRMQSKSLKMQNVLQLAKQVAGSGATILVTGETGTGKEVIAEAMHGWSLRAKQPMIKVNCGAIPDNLLESELFGYEKGAFTGAASSKPGRFELAEGGTIFLDEIGDISPAIQLKLLRVLQEKTFERLGGVKSIKADVRIIAATNRDLKEEVRKGAYREDLYYRLNVVPIHIPPLRERREDIEDLVGYFLRAERESLTQSVQKHIDSEAMFCLKNYNWPGNIRELENIIERCVVVTPGETIGVESLPMEIRAAERAERKGTMAMLNEAIDQKEREIIRNALEENNGNKTKTAVTLGISRRSLHRKLEKLGMTELE